MAPPLAESVTVPWIEPTGSRVASMLCLALAGATMTSPGAAHQSLLGWHWGGP